LLNTHPSLFELILLIDSVSSSAFYSLFKEGSFKITVGSFRFPLLLLLLSSIKSSLVFNGENLNTSVYGVFSSCSSIVLLRYNYSSLCVRFRFTFKVVNYNTFSVFVCFPKLVEVSTLIGYSLSGFNGYTLVSDCVLEIFLFEIKLTEILSSYRPLMINAIRPTV